LSILSSDVAQLWLRIYRLQVDKPDRSGFRFMVGTYGRVAIGILKIEVRDVYENKLTHKVSLPMDGTSDNQTLTINFDALIDFEGGQYDVIFSSFPEDGKSMLAIYESNITEMKIKRILRRFGFLTAGNNLACTMLYENTLAK
jgi:hypothetical protein